MPAITESTKRKLSLLQLAEELGNVSKALPHHGLPPWHSCDFRMCHEILVLGWESKSRDWRNCVLVGIGGRQSLSGPQGVAYMCVS